MIKDWGNGFGVPIGTNVSYITWQENTWRITKSTKKVELIYSGKDVHWFLRDDIISVLCHQTHPTYGIVKEWKVRVEDCVPLITFTYMPGKYIIPIITNKNFTYISPAGI